MLAQLNVNVAQTEMMANQMEQKMEEIETHAQKLASKVHMPRATKFNNDCAVFVLFIIGLSLRNNKTIS